MENPAITDDELIQSLCCEHNKSALVMLYDRHAKFLYQFIQTLVHSPDLRVRLTRKDLRDKLIYTLLIKVFTTIWDERESVMHKFKEHRSARAYLTYRATRFVHEIPSTFERDLIRNRKDCTTKSL